MQIVASVDGLGKRRIIISSNSHLHFRAICSAKRIHYSLRPLRALCANNRRNNIGIAPSPPPSATASAATFRKMQRMQRIWQPGGHPPGFMCLAVAEMRFCSAFRQYTDNPRDNGATGDPAVQSYEAIRGHCGRARKCTSHAGRSRTLGLLRGSNFIRIPDAPSFWPYFCGSGWEAAAAASTARSSESIWSVGSEFGHCLPFAIELLFEVTLPE